MESRMTDDRQCTATSKGSGDRCKRVPAPGAPVCHFHGGGSPQVAAAAERRVVAVEARALVHKLLVDPDAPPVENPALELSRIAGRMGHAVDVLGDMVNAIQEADHLEYADINRVHRMHVLFEAWQALLVEYRKTLTDMTRLGIEARAARITEQQGVLLADAVQRILDDMLAGAVEAIGDGEAAERVRRGWPVLAGEIVPRVFLAIAEGTVSG
jgi:hypothetical protein